MKRIFCDYYKQTVFCYKCRWKGPWQIFRWDPMNAITSPDGDIVDESGYAPEACPLCGSDFSGQMDKVFYGNENPYVLYVWDEKKL